jgi:hypothetical protein
MTDEPFVVESIDVARQVGGDHVRFTFLDRNNERREMFFHQSRLPTLMGVIQAEIAPGTLVPIDQGSLQIGANYRLAGDEMRKNPDLSARLILHIELPDQGRTVLMPLSLSQEEVTSLVSYLSAAQAGRS